MYRASTIALVTPPLATPPSPSLDTSQRSEEYPSDLAPDEGVVAVYGGVFVLYVYRVGLSVGLWVMFSTLQCIIVDHLV